MECWQREYIIQHKPALLNLTNCNVEVLTSLESAGVITGSEKQKLQTTTEAAEQTSQMYDIVATRVGSYEILTQALFESKQSGAFKILIEGLEANGTTSPFSTCRISVDTSKFLSGKMKFQGRDYGLAEYCKDIQPEILNTILEKTLTSSLYFDIFHSAESTPNFVILDDTIPPQPFYYVPRYLTSKNQINPEMFSQADSSDVYVFKNISRTQLTELAGPYPTDISSNQTFGLDARFILLQNDDDLEEILRMSQHCVHLIKYQQEQNIYVLEGVWGCSVSTTRYLRDNDTYLTEEDFLATLRDFRTPVVCICDVPGMGKSVLLANLARRVSEEYLDNIVAYISLPQFVQDLYTTPKPSIITSDDSILAVKFLINYISPTKLGREILIQLMTSGNRRVELFLDAFDELSQANSKWVHSLVATLVKAFEHFRIFITSRPQMQIILEKYFGVISYNIIPFDRRCQKSFLSKFWIQNIENPDTGKIKEFTNLCLDTLYKINYSDRDICGIPMQLFLLAEVFTRDVQKFTKQDSTHSEFFRRKVVISIFEMYRMYFSIKLSKDVTLEEKENAEKFHTLCALKLLLPEIAGDYRQLASSKLTQEKLLSYGIITVTPCADKLILRFVHQSFAEYIVAKLFADVLFGKFSNVKTDTKAYNSIVDILLIVIMEINECEPFENPFPELKLPKTFTMYTSANPSIMYFLNAQMKMRKHSNPKLCKNVIERFRNQMTSANLYQLWSCCAVRDNVEIISLVEGTLRRQAIQENRHLDNNEYFVLENRWYFLLLVLAMYSNNRLSLDMCFNLYSDIFNCNLHLYCSKIPKVMLTPFHIILTKGNYSIVEFFLRGSKTNDFSGRGILHACVAGTLDCSPNLLSEKRDILKLLVRNGACDINEIWNGGPALLSQNVHLDLIKCLLELGANADIVDLDGNTLAHVALEYLSLSLYHQLLKYLQTSNCIGMLKVENKNGQLPLNTAMSMMSFDLSSDAFRLMLELAYELKISVYSEENSIEASLYFESEYLHPLLGSDSIDGEPEVIPETVVNEKENDAGSRDESMVEYIQNQVCSLV